MIERAVARQTTNWCLQFDMSNDEEKNDIIPYQVDRMRNVQISKKDVNLNRPFNLEEYHPMNRELLMEDCLCEPCEAGSSYCLD